MEDENNNVREDNHVALRERHTELVRTIEAIDEVLRSKGWQTLKELVFDKVVARLDRLLLSEAKKTKVEEDKIYHLQGELAWARRYSDLKSYAEMLKKELEGINLKLK